MTQPQSTSRLSPADIERYRANFKDEVDGAALYRLLADAEENEALQDVYRRLAESEDRHRALWERKLREAGAEVPKHSVSGRVRILGWLARRFGTDAIAPIVTRMEMGAVGMYDDQPEAIEHGLPRDERSHARLFREIGRSGRGLGVDIASIEGRHRGSGNALRAGVLGVNDGLMSNLSLVMGVAGASPGQDVVLLTGVAGLVAGAFSMGMGEWVSVRSSQELFERQVAIERDELAELPEEEEEELTLIYQAKGMHRDEAKAFARRILADPETALETLTREELGMSEAEAGSPMVAAVTSFLLFTLGALVPLLPWLFAGGAPAVALSAVLAGLALFGVGAAITVLTGRSALVSGLRQLAIGLAVAAVTFGGGYLVGELLGIDAAL